MDLLAFERKLDSTIMRKRLEIQEVIRRPMRQKRKLRVFISHQFSTMEPEEAVSTVGILFSRKLSAGLSIKKACECRALKWTTSHIPATV